VQRGGEPRQLAESLPRKIGRLEIALAAELPAIEKKKDQLALDTKEDRSLLHIKKHGPRVKWELAEFDIDLSRDFYEWGRIYLDVGAWKDAKSCLTKYKIFVDRKDTEILDPSDDNHKFLLQECETEINQQKEEDEIKKKKEELEQKKQEDAKLEHDQQWEEELRLMRQKQEEMELIMKQQQAQKKKRSQKM